MVTLTTFDPYAVPWQAKVLELLRKKWQGYPSKIPEILLSGGYGSAKSTLLAHIAVTHCLFNKGACVAICRRALPDLKRTIFAEILEHIDPLTEGKHYRTNHTSCYVYFPPTNSTILSVTWADRRYKKIRSLRLSGVIIEEGAENDEEDFEAFKQLRARLNRRPPVRENFLIVATNPDSPDHWLYKYFIASQPHERRFVFYSSPFDNPFIPREYIETLRQDLDPISVQRYIEGKWVALDGNQVYYAFSPELSVTNRKYEFSNRLPVDVSFDFNVAHGKPLSAALGQYDPATDTFHVAASVTIESISTLDMMQELYSRGYLTLGNMVRVFGDATGAARSSKSLMSDYDLIAKFLSNNGINHELCVPRSNPPIKERHNTVNAYLKNGNGVTRVFLYSGTEKLQEGLRLTSLKKGGQYIEDDSKDYQHVTTALGYWICYLARSKANNKIKWTTER